AASRIRTLSSMAASVGCLSAATAPHTNIRASMTAQILGIIFNGHCTPVQRIQEGSILAPARLHANVKIQIDLYPEDTLHFLSGQHSDLLQHRSAGADQDSF